ncbi:MAG: hypothetical protein CO162_07965 [bacterium (Candidatus Ratteibacteria) CG_4_9_14_3_um_filter_41_21]|uniref:Uncharacterized protein n=2 Tax=Candidatus Ratteibacteria TaxID=2979319 RepID=A0A2M7YDV9_9BACT|nr:MAG: hypothetical protein CO162_07965 [bacterium (Candidatus Ratteibacteria) CG_4_9_14_3_um_filter_41_21]
MIEKGGKMVSGKVRREIFLLLPIFIFIFFLELHCPAGRFAFGETEKKKEEVPAKKKAELEREEQEKLINEKRAALNNTEWQITVTPLEQKEEKPHQDTLRFVNNQVVSENFAIEGYPATNYSLTVKQDGTVIWETMQTKIEKEEKEITFWRGEWRDERMKGIISRQYKVKEISKHDDYSFASVSWKKIEEGEIKEEVKTDTPLQIKKPKKK